MKNSRVMPCVVLVATGATIAFNSLANSIPLNGLTTGEISDRFQVLIVPAGYVFSIWGLIYLGLIAFSVYQLIPSRRNDPELQRIRVPFLVSCAANITWLTLWHYEQFVLTVVAMTALLLSLIAVYLGLGNRESKVPAGKIWLVRVPFSIYLGWITVAAIANVSTVLTFFEWNGFGISAVIWTRIMLAAGVLLGTLMTLQHQDLAYDLVLVWAFIGIALKHSAMPDVAISAWIAAGLVGLVLAPASLLIPLRRTASIAARGQPGSDITRSSG